MKKKSFLLLTAATALLSFKSTDASKWNIDNAHAKVGFVITHMMVSDVDGYFKKVSATVTSSNTDFTDAVAEMSAEVNSIFTDNDQRDGHLKSADFFDAAKFPLVTFKSASFKKGKEGNYVVTGDLTMHGITKQVTMNAIAKTGENPMSKKMTAGFKITGKINRKDFGIGSSMPSAMLSEEVEVKVNAEFIKN